MPAGYIASEGKLFKCDIFKKNKRAKIILLCIIVIAAAAVVIFAFFPRSGRDSEKMTVYYKSRGDPETYMAILRGKDAEKIKSVLANYKYGGYPGEAMDDIDNPAYKIEGEHKGSSDLDFNYAVYKRKNYYIVMDYVTGYVTAVKGKDYDTLKEFLSESNLRSLESGPDYS